MERIPSKCSVQMLRVFLSRFTSATNASACRLDNGAKNWFLGASSELSAVKAHLRWRLLELIWGQRIR